MTVVEGLLRIGDFGVVTRLSVKTLRHYHEIGLLEPAAVDPMTGYRWYRPDQARRALAIRMLRDLDLPLADVAAVVDELDPVRRTALLDRHRARLQSQLDEVARRLTHIGTILEEDPMTRTLHVTDKSLEPMHVVSKRVHCPTGLEQAVTATTISELVAQLDQEPAGPLLCLVHGGDEAGSDQEVCIPVEPGTPGAWLLDGTSASVARHEGPLSDSVTVVPDLIADVVTRHGGYRMPIRVTFLAVPPLFGDGEVPVVSYAVPYDG